MDSARDTEAKARVSRRYEGERASAYYQDFQRPSARRGVSLLEGVFGPHVHRDDRLVDFGCGGGWLIERLDVAEKVGIEVNPVARADALGRGLDVRADLGEVPDAFADVVISNHALEHTLEPYAALGEIRRVLRPGGRLVLVLPVGDWRAERRVERDDVNGHMFSWTSQNIYNLLTEVGFDQVRPEVISEAWPPKADVLARVPPLYRASARIWSQLRRIRELRTVARNPPAGSEA